MQVSALPLHFLTGERARNEPRVRVYSGKGADAFMRSWSALWNAKIKEQNALWNAKIKEQNFVL